MVHTQEYQRENPKKTRRINFYKTLERGKKFVQGEEKGSVENSKPISNNGLIPDTLFIGYNYLDQKQLPAYVG